MIHKIIMAVLLLSPSNLFAELTDFSFSKKEFAFDALPTEMSATVLSDAAVRFECVTCDNSEIVVAIIIQDPKNTEAAVREGRITSEDFREGSQSCNRPDECLGGQTFIDEQYAGFVRAVRLTNSEIVVTRLVSSHGKLLSITSKSRDLDTATKNEVAIWEFLASQIF